MVLHFSPDDKILLPVGTCLGCFSCVLSPCPLPGFPGEDELWSDHSGINPLVITGFSGRCVEASMLIPGLTLLGLGHQGRICLICFPHPVSLRRMIILSFSIYYHFC